MYITYIYTHTHTHTHLTINAALLCTCDVLPISLSPHSEFYETSERKIRFLFIFSELLLGPEGLTMTQNNSDNNIKWNCMYGSSVCFKLDLAH